MALMLLQASPRYRPAIGSLESSRVHPQEQQVPSIEHQLGLRLVAR